MRKRLASLSFSEKVKILEKLRDRDRAIAAAGLRKKVPKKINPPHCEWTVRGGGREGPWTIERIRSLKGSEAREPF